MKKLTIQQAAARKAVRTTRARKTLREQYGQATYEIAAFNFTELGGYANDAAIRANINRTGKLQQLVKTCNFKKGYLNTL